MTQIERTPPDVLVERVPFRTEPAPGEWWPAYLRRVADTWGVAQNWLTDPVLSHIRPYTGDRPWCPARRLGIAMTAPVAAAFARRLNLLEEEVHAMQLRAHAGRSWWGSGDPAEDYDPILGACGIQHYRSLGWVQSASVDRRCEACWLENPGVIRLEWRHPWFLVCPRHRAPVGPTPVLLPRRAFDACEQVTRRLDAIRRGEASFTRVSPGDGFKELAAVAYVLARPLDHRGRALPNVAPELMWQVLPTAFEVLENPLPRWPGAARPLLDGWCTGYALHRALESMRATSPFGTRHDLASFYEEGHLMLLAERGGISLPTHSLAATSPLSPDEVPLRVPISAIPVSLQDLLPDLTPPEMEHAVGQALALTLTGRSHWWLTGGEKMLMVHQRPLRRVLWFHSATGRLDDFLDELWRFATDWLGQNQPSGWAPNVVALRPRSHHPRAM